MISTSGTKRVSQTLIDFTENASGKDDIGQYKDPILVLHSHDQISADHCQLSMLIDFCVRTSLDSN